MMLLKKREVHYRKREDKTKNCGTCKNNIEIDIRAIGGSFLYVGNRCKVIGLENSRRYSISDNFVCDQFQRD